MEGVVDVGPLMLRDSVANDETLALSVSRCIIYA
jgi:hypothetical protein